MAVERKDGDVKEAGQSVYLTRILWKLPDGDKGKMVVIDVDSGDYETDADEAAARKRLLARRPHARTWTEEFQGPPVIRVGWRMAHPNFMESDEDIALFGQLVKELNERHSLNYD